MKWSHLPVEGGLYDQHPKLLDDFQIIMATEASVERKRRAREKNQKMGGGRPK